MALGYMASSRWDSGLGVSPGDLLTEEQLEGLPLGNMLRIGTVVEVYVPELAAPVPTEALPPSPPPTARSEAGVAPAKERAKAALRRRRKQ